MINFETLFTWRNWAAREIAPNDEIFPSKFNFTPPTSIDEMIYGNFLTIEIKPLDSNQAHSFR